MLLSQLSQLEELEEVAALLSSDCCKHNPNRDELQKMDGVIYSYLSICFNLYNELWKQKPHGGQPLTGFILDSGAGETKGFLYACLRT